MPREVSYYIEYSREDNNKWQSKKNKIKHLLNGDILSKKNKVISRQLIDAEKKNDKRKNTNNHTRNKMRSTAAAATSIPITVSTVPTPKISATDPAIIIGTSARADVNAFNAP